GPGPISTYPPFLMSDRLFRIEKIAAFGGGVKCNSQNPKRGGGGFPRGGNRVQKCSHRQSSLIRLGPHAPPRPRLAETRQVDSRLTGGAPEHESLDTTMLITLRAPKLERLFKKCAFIRQFLTSSL